MSRMHTVVWFFDLRDKAFKSGQTTVLQHVQSEMSEQFVKKLGSNGWENCTVFFDNADEPHVNAEDLLKSIEFVKNKSDRIRVRVCLFVGTYDQRLTAIQPVASGLCCVTAGSHHQSFVPERRQQAHAITSSCQKIHD
jgi:hypothetical protein